MKARRSLRLFDEPGQEWPDWYTPTKERRAANARVARGLHPMGAPLGRADQTCGDCDHLYQTGTRAGGTYYKCELSPATHGPATDVRKKWRSCESFESAAAANAAFTASVKRINARCQAMGLVMPVIAPLQSVADALEVALDGIEESGALAYWWELCGLDPHAPESEG